MGSRLRRHSGCLALLLLVLILFPGTIASLVQAASFITPQYLRIGAGAVNSPGFGVAGAIAGVLSSPLGGPSCANGGSCGIPGMIAIVHSIPKLPDRLAALRRGDIDLALVSGNEARQIKGQGGFRAVAGLTTETIQLMVPAKSRIRSHQQLRNRRVALVDTTLQDGEDSTGSTLRAWAESIGISGTYYSRKAGDSAEVPLTMALKRLEAQQLDALILYGTAPNRQLAAYAISHEVRFLPLRNLAEGLDLTRLTQASDLYNGQPETATLGTVSQFIARADMPRDLVYSICQSLWDERSLKAYSANNSLKLVGIADAQKGLQWRIHPGAAKFYRENTVLKPVTVEKPKK
ncbi:MAG: hypothetical protein ORO03_00780 [Alphaproteobacteria bacterium]|nr:hypothetical protein [Alphaproteobacteria bacterium]